jgi:hypothetical protein
MSIHSLLPTLLLLLSLAPAIHSGDAAPIQRKAPDTSQQTVASVWRLTGETHLPNLPEELCFAPPYLLWNSGNIIYKKKFTDSVFAVVDTLTDPHSFAVDPACTRVYFVAEEGLFAFSSATDTLQRLLGITSLKLCCTVDGGSVYMAFYDPVTVLFGFNLKNSLAPRLLLGFKSTAHIGNLLARNGFLYYKREGFIRRMPTQPNYASEDSAWTHAAEFKVVPIGFRDCFTLSSSGDKLAVSRKEEGCIKIYTVTSSPKLSDSLPGTAVCLCIVSGYLIWIVEPTGELRYRKISDKTGGSFNLLSSSNDEYKLLSRSGSDAIVVCGRTSSSQQPFVRIFSLRKTH